jgi:hypothetical protein
MNSIAVLALAAAAVVSPLMWKKTTPYADLSLTLPKQVQHVPVLNNRLHRGEIKALEAFAAQAADPKDGLRSEPPEFRQHGRWTMEVTYSAGVETPRLISLIRRDFQDAHGAHPNHSIGGVVFDKATNTNLHALDLLKAGADVRPLDKALCEAARAAKRKRNDHWVEKEDSNFNCPTWKGVVDKNGKLLEGTGPAQITLAASDKPGRAAGLIFLYSPYDLGAYAEGEYEILIPASVFQNALKREYAAEFAGKPRLIKLND